MSTDTDYHDQEHAEQTGRINADLVRKAAKELEADATKESGTTDGPELPAAPEDSGGGYVAVKEYVPVDEAPPPNPNWPTTAASRLETKPYERKPPSPYERQRQKDNEDWSRSQLDYKASQEAERAEQQ